MRNTVDPLVSAASLHDVGGPCEDPDCEECKQQYGSDYCESSLEEEEEQGFWKCCLGGWLHWTEPCAECGDWKF